MRGSLSECDRHVSHLSIWDCGGELTLSINRIGLPCTASTPPGSARLLRRSEALRELEKRLRESRPIHRIFSTLQSAFNGQWSDALARPRIDDAQQIERDVRDAIQASVLYSTGLVAACLFGWTHTKSWRQTFGLEWETIQIQLCDLGSVY